MTTPEQDAALCEHAARVFDGQGRLTIGRQLRALAVKLRGMGERDTCAVCGADLLPDPDVPHCPDCVVTEDVQDEYEARAAHPAPAAGDPTYKRMCKFAKDASEKEHGDE